VPATALAADAARKASDIRGKTAIAPAGGAISDAYRGIGQANEQASRITGTEVSYPLGRYNAYGAVTPGNIDLEHRPRVVNPDGSVSTVRSMGVNIDGHEVLIPTVSDDGRIMSDREAIETYRNTGRHLGEYKSPRASTAASKAIHADQERSVFSPLSASSYLYKNPGAPGAEPGQHYGPMAHELERTPAGASVVRTMPDGSKGIDTGRLALLNASETGKLRREVDALKNEGVSGTVSGAASTGTVKPARLGALAAKQEANAKKSSKNDRLAALISSRTGSIADRLSNPLRRTVLPTYAPPPIYAQPLPQQPQPLALPQPSYFYGQ
jgi:hypothetical protein